MVKIGITVGETHLLLELTDWEQQRYEELLALEPEIISRERRAEIIHMVLNESDKIKDTEKSNDEKK